MLPIESIFSILAEQLKHDNAIVVAPPGAGKSTCLPLYLLTLEQFATDKIIMLQPRRIAARNIAQYLAGQLNEAPGERVGYRIRGESKVSEKTRIEIVTEGVLTRMLQSSPELEGVSLIVFDEFHERSIHADFSLALSIEVQQALRNDLRLLVMSATLEIEGVKSILPAAKVLKCEGKQHAVDIVYLDDTGQQADYRGQNRQIKQSLSQRLIARVCNAVKQVFDQHTKDVLVFLPGAKEIQKVAGQLTELFDESALICMLYGGLAFNKQQLAFMPAPAGKRKIILSTNIAETSVTIDGVEVVIDSMMEKVAVFNLNKGITSLRMQAISQASATQRAGRAGRLMAGTCYRLCSQSFFERLAQQSKPEILTHDVKHLVFEAAIWGSQLHELPLIDQPSAAQLKQALTALVSQGLLKPQGFNNTSNLPMSFEASSSNTFLSDGALLNHSDEFSVSPLGQRAHRWGTDLSIAVMIERTLSAIDDSKMEKRHLSLALAIASLIENKDPLSHQGPAGADIQKRLQFLQYNKAHLIWKDIRHWHRRLNLSLNLCEQWPLEESGILVAFGFPHWISMHNGEGALSLSTGGMARLGDEDPLLSIPKQAKQFVAVASMFIHQSDQQAANNKADPKVTLASLLPVELLKKYKEPFAHLFTEKETVHWDKNAQSISARRLECFGQIVLSSTPLPKPSAAQIMSLWQAKIREQGPSFIDALPFEQASMQLLRRLNFVSLYYPSLLPKSLTRLDNKFLLEHADKWLLPSLSTCMSWQSLSKLCFYDLLHNYLIAEVGYTELKRVLALVPEKYALASGDKATLEYQQDGTVVLSARIQAFYGLNSHPCILQGKLSLTLHLLSPANRPIQITQDISKFWEGSYQAVKKEMKGRYPKHIWPDDPANATATLKTKQAFQRESQTKNN